MRILVLGGTVFLGYHLVNSALEYGHDVTIFTRGKSNPSLFPNVKKLYGDRDGNLEALKGGQWDAVIDTSGYLPRVVGESAKILADLVDHYTFVSSISVYKDFSRPGVNEESPIKELMDDQSSEDLRKYYGELKALCEQTIESTMPGKVLHVRPGLIVGPLDPTDRFTHWPVRINQGAEVLAPGNPENQVQFIDVRDLADWIIKMVETKQTGTYNATGPDYLLTMKEFLEHCKEVSKSNAKITWVSEDFLINHEVQPWIEMPLWVSTQGENATNANLLAVNIDKAKAAGLHFRPLSETIKETISWDSTRNAIQKRNAGMTREKEDKLLKEWNNMREV